MFIESCTSECLSMLSPLRTIKMISSPATVCDSFRNASLISLLTLFLSTAFLVDRLLIARPNLAMFSLFLLANSKNCPFAIRWDGFRNTLAYSSALDSLCSGRNRVDSFDMANYADRTFRPLALRRFKINLPDFVAILARNPCLRLRFRTLGWNVRFMVLPVEESN